MQKMNKKHVYKKKKRISGEVRQAVQNKLGLYKKKVFHQMFLVDTGEVGGFTRDYGQWPPNSPHIAREKKEIQHNKNWKQKSRGTYQHSPLLELVGDDSAPLWDPVVEDGGDAQHQPADVEAARRRVQLVDARVPHPHRHQLTADEHWNNIDWLID